MSNKKEPKVSSKAQEQLEASKNINQILSSEGKALPADMNRRIDQVKTVTGWPDEDIRRVLEELNFDTNQAVQHIMDGDAGQPSQWSEVKKKGTKQPESSKAKDTAQAAAAHPAQPRPRRSPKPQDQRPKPSSDGEQGAPAGRGRGGPRKEQLNGPTASRGRGRGTGKPHFGQNGHVGDGTPTFQAKKPVHHEANGTAHAQPSHPAAPAQKLSDWAGAAHRGMKQEAAQVAAAAAAANASVASASPVNPPAPQEAVQPVAAAAPQPTESQATKQPASSPHPSHSPGTKWQPKKADAPVAKAQEASPPPTTTQGATAASSHVSHASHAPAVQAAPTAAPAITHTAVASASPVVLPSSTQTMLDGPSLMFGADPTLQGQSALHEQLSQQQVQEAQAPVHHIPASQVAAQQSVPQQMAYPYMHPGFLPFPPFDGSDASRPPIPVYADAFSQYQHAAQTTADGKQFAGARGTGVMFGGAKDAKASQGTTDSAQQGVGVQPQPQPYTMPGVYYPPYYAQQFASFPPSQGQQYGYRYPFPSGRGMHGYANYAPNTQTGYPASGPSSGTGMTTAPYQEEEYKYTTYNFPVEQQRDTSKVQGAQGSQHSGQHVSHSQQSQQQTSSSKGLSFNGDADLSHVQSSDYGAFQQASGAPASYYQMQTAQHGQQQSHHPQAALHPQNQQQTGFTTFMPQPVPQQHYARAPQQHY